MKVHIVCYEDVNEWILGKFALKMHENLQKLGIESSISKHVDATADINHHIIYNGYDGKKSSIDTLMVTHIDNINKLEQMKWHLQVAAIGICMSKETTLYLAQMGVNKNRLCYINPAHDGVMPIKKIVIGWSCRVYEDGRKCESFIDKLAEKLNPTYFCFRVMGSGWEPQINDLRQHNFEVDYINHFDYDEYVKMIPTLDYYLYMGMDEGQMGWIDALAAGVKTIVTAQGYHLDAPYGITHPFTTYEELEKILLDIQTEKANLVNAVATWNWVDYTKKHIEIWEYLLGKQNIKNSYTDGINSLFQMQKADIVQNKDFEDKERKRLRKGFVRLQYFFYKNKLKEIYITEGITGIIKLIPRVMKRILSD
jgi:hypothetical protein